jgi:hypothetical protein
VLPEQFAPPLLRDEFYITRVSPPHIPATLLADELPVQPPAHVIAAKVRRCSAISTTFLPTLTPRPRVDEPIELKTARECVRPSSLAHEDEVRQRRVNIRGATKPWRRQYVELNECF